jgi:hypothetical protein
MAVAFLGCGGGNANRTEFVTAPATSPGNFAAEDAYVPTYGKAELQKALIAERGAEATGERVVGELEAKVTDGPTNDRWRTARADLEVRRRFIRSLETCESSRIDCPPRLDDPTWSYDPDPDVVVAPKVDADLRFDLGSWQKLSAEMFGRACACRTIACVDSVGVAIDQLEVRPMATVQGDETASLSITRARECLFRLRGKALSRALSSPADSE